MDRRRLWNRKTPPRPNQLVGVTIVLVIWLNSSLERLANETGPDYHYFIHIWGIKRLLTNKFSLLY